MDCTTMESKENQDESQAVAKGQPQREQNQEQASNHDCEQAEENKPEEDQSPKPPAYMYTDEDLIHQTPSWEYPGPPPLSKFDQALHKRWDDAMDSGIFRYGIDHILTRILPGDKRYVGQLNTYRETKRRKPQEITSMHQPFNPNAFNFTWTRNEEVICDLHNVTGLNLDIESGLCDAEVAPSDPDCHRLILNVSPMEYGHCLFVPQIYSRRPQILALKSLEVAIEVMLLSNHRGLRMGFNSLTAFASVNHLHFHFYYLEYELVVDRCPVQHLAGPYYEFTALPCPGFALQLHGTTPKEMARQAHRIISHFTETDMAHNIFMSRGTVFGEPKTSSHTTLRLFVWPRKKFIGKKSSEEFNVACLELGGHLPIKKEDGYYNLTEADVDAIIADANLPRAEYEAIRDLVTTMGQEEGEAKEKRDLISGCNNDAPSGSNFTCHVQASDSSIGH